MNEKIIKLREQISAKKQALADLDAAGLPADDALGLLQARVDRAVADYYKAVARLATSTIAARHDADVDFSGALGTVFGQPENFIIGAIFRHLGTKVVEDVWAEIARIQGEHPPGINDQKLAAERKRLVRELLSLERQEEAEIEAELLLGNQVERRSDADPRAVLAIPDDVLAAAGLL